MLRKVLCCIALGFGALVCHGQSSSEFRACSETAKTQSALNQCANEEALRADTLLNSTYTQALSQLASDENASAKLRAMEEAWALYRDAYLDALFPAADKQRKYGTEFPMVIDLVRAQLTQDHVKTLQEVLRHYEVGN